MTIPTRDELVKLSDLLLSLSDVEQSFGRVYNCTIMREVEAAVRKAATQLESDGKRIVELEADQEGWRLAALALTKKAVVERDEARREAGRWKSAYEEAKSLALTAIRAGKEGK